MIYCRFEEVRPKFGASFVTDKLKRIMVEVNYGRDDI